jgi:hypothetical protein
VYGRGRLTNNSIRCLYAALPNTNHTNLILTEGRRLNIQNRNQFNQSIMEVATHDQRRDYD